MFPHSKHKIIVTCTGTTNDTVSLLRASNSAFSNGVMFTTVLYIHRKQIDV